MAVSRQCRQRQIRIIGSLSRRFLQRVGESRRHFLQAVPPAAFRPVNYQIRRQGKSIVRGLMPDSKGQVLYGARANIIGKIFQMQNLLIDRFGSRQGRRVLRREAQRHADYD